MEILQSKIYGKNDNFNLEEGKSYSSLKSSFIIKQINDKVGKIYITDSLGYCIKIFDIELNDEIKSLSRNLEEYKLKVTELLTDQKTSLTQLINNKSTDVEGIKTSTNELKESVKEIKKKLPKKIIWEDSKVRLKLQDDTFLETEQINIVTENTKIKSFKYEAGVFKITDTNDTVFPSNVDLTQLFAPKIHNHDTEYVKLNDERLTNARVASDVHQWAKQRNKPVYNWGEIQNKPEFNYLPLSGGVLTPGDVVWYDGLKIAKSTAGWSTFLLGSNSGLDNTSWMIARNPQGQLMIQSTDNGIDTGLLLSNDFLKWKGSTFSVTKDGEVYVNKLLESPRLVLHVPGIDYVSLNSKGYKLNVKNGSDGRDNGQFVPVLASGYEINGKTNNEVVLAGGGVTNLSELKNENIKIGGRNLLRLTKDFVIGYSSEPYYIIKNYVTESWDIVNEKFNGNVVRKVGGGDWRGIKTNIPDIIGEPVIISFWAKSTGSANFSNFAMANKNPNGLHTFTKVSNDGRIIGDGKWHRYIIYNPKGMCLGEGINNGFLEFYSFSADVYVSSIKIEIGNKPTDWTPAPEDLENNLIEKTIANNEKVLESKDELPIKTRKNILINNSGSRINLETLNNELTVTTHSGWAKVNSNGYKKIGSSEDHFLLGNGEHEHRKFLGRCGEISSNWTITQSWYGQSINILAQCNVNLSPMENNFNISFRKCFAGGQVTFTTTGKTVIFTGDNQFNGGDGSTCVVSSINNKLYIDIRNI